MRAIVVGGLALVLWLAAWSKAHAHDLQLDLIELRPLAEPGLLRGQLTLDPELTRELSAAASPAVKQKVLALVDQALRVEVDGRTLRLETSVRELWQRGGAVPGDVVLVKAAVPLRARELRLELAPPLRDTIVTVDTARDGKPAELHSRLLREGERSVRFGLSAANGPEWVAGGARQLGDVRPTPPLPEEPWWVVSLRYTLLGIEHIVPKGWDHIAFVSGLVLGFWWRREQRRRRSLLLEVSAFTLAHTLTLLLASLGYLVLSPALVEPLIALSVLYIAVESRWPMRFVPRWAIVFSIGLIHGLGFSSVLTDAGLPREVLLPALLSFNVGVELGQLAVLGFWLSLLWLGRRHSQASHRGAGAGLLVIGCLGATWFLLRLFG